MTFARALATSATFATLALVAACSPELTPTTGKSDYAQFCASCHGPSGKGDGPVAAELKPRPADLTLLAKRNGGSFPRLSAMEQIHGATMGRSESQMPEFGDILSGKTVLYDAGDGIETPTPWRLVALTKYLETLQQK
ncbi:c-type cytochrome [Paracoccus aminophilus]|uniref:Cytochrome c family protein n=1 Tax=Paracoccus aminophilus JCM 7686 TaxID=1367847 RepID=S5Y1L3_PARAH|nr:c-type cytochrome [Paracoccus aminophilus]AGT09595.1 cytochrome c family protein [Paracoccus aminophilus JCM 7686]